jgi:hypothetical protein
MAAALYPGRILVDAMITLGASDGWLKPRIRRLRVTNGRPASLRTSRFRTPAISARSGLGHVRAAQRAAYSHNS